MLRMMQDAIESTVDAIEDAIMPYTPEELRAQKEELLAQKQQERTALSTKLSNIRAKQHTTLKDFKLEVTNLKKQFRIEEESLRHKIEKHKEFRQIQRATQSEIFLKQQRDSLAKNEALLAKAQLTNSAKLESARTPEEKKNSGWLVVDEQKARLLPKPDVDQNHLDRNIDRTEHKLADDLQERIKKTEAAIAQLHEAQKQEAKEYTEKRTKLLTEIKELKETHEKTMNALEAEFDALPKHSAKSARLSVKRVLAKEAAEKKAAEETAAKKAAESSWGAMLSNLLPWSTSTSQPAPVQTVQQNAQLTADKSAAVVKTAPLQPSVADTKSTNPTEAAKLSDKNVFAKPNPTPASVPVAAPATNLTPAPKQP